MSLLLESIRVENNIIQNLAYHQERIRRSLELCYDSSINDPIDYNLLSDYANSLDDTRHKLRIEYNDESFTYTCKPYLIRSLNRLRLAYVRDMSYAVKYADRNSINQLYKTKGTADDILIIINGKVTDTSYSNVAFLQDGIWYTPKYPLLKGTMRAKLLDTKEIKTRNINAVDLKDYESCRLFNAMIDFGQVELLVDDIENLPKESF